jgi:hypothetical protein
VIHDEDTIRIGGAMKAPDTPSPDFSYALVSGKAQLIAPNLMAARYPKIWSYLQQNKDLLQAWEGGSEKR